MSAVAPERLHEAAPDLARLARSHRLGLGGAGAAGGEPAVRDALVLTADPVTEAERVTALF